MWNELVPNQESNNNVFDSRSCTHVLLQVKVYASNINTNTWDFTKFDFQNLRGVSNFAKERRGEKHTL